MEELEIGDYINDINSYHLHMFDKHDVTTKKLDVIVEKVGKVDANYAAQIEGYCSLLGEYGKKFETVCAMLALDLIGVIPVIGALKYSDEIGTLFKNADKVSVVARSTDGTGVLARHADEAGAWLQGVKVFRYSDETAEAVASGEKLLKESGTIYESFADMMSPDDAAKYLDFLENGSKEGLTSAELAGVEKADALLVSQKVEYEDVWDLRNAGDLLESGEDSVDDIVKGVENGDILLSNNIQKGNYGEMNMDVYFKSQGYERISLDRVTDLNAPTHQGIDGVYYNLDGHPPYIIGEAKYGSSRLAILADGTPQMSDKWIIDRLENAVGEGVANDIKMEMILNPDNVGSILVHVSSNGEIDITKLIDGIKQ